MIRYCFQCKKLTNVRIQVLPYSKIFDLIQEHCETCNAYICQYLLKKETK